MTKNNGDCLTECTPTQNVETTRNEKYFAPRVDIFESESELTLHADLPGVAPKDVDLRYEHGELILQGKVSSAYPTGHSILAEYDQGDFYRVFQVHESIDSTRIAAECKNGVLTVHLPKAEAAKPKQVAVKG